MPKHAKHGKDRRRSTGALLSGYARMLCALISVSSDLLVVFGFLHYFCTSAFGA